MKVIALRPGYMGKLREAGEVFDAPDGAKGSWFVPAETEPASEQKPKAAPKGKAPAADSNDLV